MAQVKTVSGKLVDENLCKKMQGEWYEIGDVNVENSGDCYLIKDKYRKVKTNYIIYDHGIGKYILKKDFRNNNFCTEVGVVGVSPDGKLITGAFSSNDNFAELNRVYNPETDTKMYYVHNRIFRNNYFYRESLSDGIYYPINKIPAIDFILPKKCSSRYKNSLPYDSRDRLDSLIQYHIKNYKFNEEDSMLSELNDITYGLTFGLEFETIRGTIPQAVTDRLGLMPLRDGSIEGLEYVTIPLSGNKGLDALINSVRSLRKRTRYNEHCSLHLHVGNMPRTESFFLALYKLLYFLQNEVYELFPFYKKENLGYKRKHYTKPLPFEQTMMLFDKKITKDNLKDNFNILYNFLSMGYSYKQAGGDLSKVKAHPSDPGGNAKWNIRTRYHWVNLIPLLFGNKQTIEFRVHTPTYDMNKIIYYMSLCFSIIYIAKKFEKDILEDPDFLNKIGGLNHIVPFAMGDYTRKMNNRTEKFCTEVSSYIQRRREFFHAKLRQKDFYVKEDTFKYNPRFSMNFNKYHLYDAKKGFVVDYETTKKSIYESNLYQNLVAELEEPDIQQVNLHDIVGDNAVVEEDRRFRFVNRGGRLVREEIPNPVVRPRRGAQPMIDAAEREAFNRAMRNDLERMRLQREDNNNG